MDNLKFLKKNYYLNSSISYFKSNFEKRIKFIKQKIFLFEEIASFINNCIDSTKNVFIFCAGNSLIAKNINCKKIFIKEIDDKYHINHNEKITYLDENVENKLSE